MSTEARFEQKRVRAPSAGRTENELAESSVKTEVMKGHSVVTRLQVMLTALIKGIKKGGKEKERAEGRQCGERMYFIRTLAFCFDEYQ